MFLNDAFLSIVDKSNDEERIFFDAEVHETPRNDYSFRARIHVEAVALPIR